MNFAFANFRDRRQQDRRHDSHFASLALLFCPVFHRRRWPYVVVRWHLCKYKTVEINPRRARWHCRKSEIDIHWRRTGEMKVNDQMAVPERMAVRRIWR